MTQTLSLSNVQAAIFDMDGTMVNNMAYHKRAWDEFCDRYSLELTEETYKKKISGKKNNDILTLLFERKLSSLEIEKYSAEKEAMYRKLYAPDIQPVDGLLEIIQKIQERGIILAIATTAPQKNREFVLKKLGLQNTFSTILGDEDVSKGKPAPEIYLKIVKKLGLQPQSCIAFEDSPPGVESAKVAGMTVIGILTAHSEEDLAKADLRVKDFSELIFT